jgi:hypothetical protein
MQLYDKSLSSIPKESRYRIVLAGGGNGNAPTVSVGQGWTVSRPAAGRIVLKLANNKDNPGTFVGFDGKPALRDATQANVKNFDVTGGTWDATNQQIELDVWNGSGTATDLAATNFLDVSLVFSQLSTTKF